MLCIFVAKRYILQQKSLNKWIGRTKGNTILQLSTLHTDPEPSKSPPPKLQTLHVWNNHADHGSGTAVPDNGL